MYEVNDKGHLVKPRVGRVGLPHVKKWRLSDSPMAVAPWNCPWRGAVRVAEVCFFLRAQMLVVMFRIRTLLPLSTLHPQRTDEWLSSWVGNEDSWYQTDYWFQTLLQVSVGWSWREACELVMRGGSCLATFVKERLLRWCERLLHCFERMRNFSDFRVCVSGAYS